MAPLSRRAEWSRDQPISFLMQQSVENPGVLALSAGLVDPDTLPVEVVREAVDALLSDPRGGRSALQYGTTPGYLPLRRQVRSLLAQLERLDPDELGVGDDQILLTTGSQQFLSIVGEVLVDPGDIVLVSAPTYFAYLGCLNGLGARTIAVPSDGEGMQTAELDRILGELDRQGELPRVKLIYVVSWFENPTGISLSVPRRKELVELARRWSRAQPIYVLEDAAYRELCYESDEMPSVWSFDRDRTHVILAQTFSKTFSPGIRVGFGVVPETLRAAAAARKGNEDFGSSNFNQQVIAWVLEHGRYAPHVDRVRAGYRRKRDAMLAAADRYCSGIPGVHWVRPRGGLYVWMTVPPAVDTSFRGALFHHATRQNQVMYVPGDVCYGGVADPPRNQMRLSFGVLDVDRLEEAIQRLACGIQAVLERSPAASAASG